MGVLPIVHAGHDASIARMKGWLPALAVGALAVVVATLVALTLRQPMIPTYAPTPPAPRDAGRALVGPVLYTVDATASEEWRWFSFRRTLAGGEPGAAVRPPVPQALRAGQFSRSPMRRPILQV